MGASVFFAWLFEGKYYFSGYYVPVTAFYLTLGSVYAIYRLVFQGIATVQAIRDLQNPDLIQVGEDLERGTRVALTIEQLQHHLHVLGASGFGKSVFLSHLYRHHIRNGLGLIFVDLKADSDTVAEITTFCKNADRLKDLRILDLSRPNLSLSYNPCKRGNPTEIKDKLVGAFVWESEYTALVATGALNFEDAVNLVRQRGQFMEEEAVLHPGKMLSLIGLDLTVVKQICIDAGAEIANINCPGQTVISGGPTEIARAEELAKEKAAKMAVVLEVSGAFHSSFMRGASWKLAAEIDKIKINLPSIPVVSNVTARPFASVAEIKENLVKQVYSNVLWEDSMKFVLSKGVTNFIEFGPGKVLRGLLRRIDAAAQVQNIEKKEDVEGACG